MGHQRLTTGEVEAATRHLPGGAAPARLLEEKDRNQVFAVGDQAIFKAYLSDGRAKQARKIAALEFLAGHGLPVPRLLGHGIVPNSNGGVPWTLETRIAADHIRPGRGELDTPWGWEFNHTLGRWLPTLHAFGGFPSFGTWQADVHATLAGHVLPRASTIRAQAADLGLDSPIFQSFLAGYLEHGQLDPGAPERFAFYQLEHCLGILGWAHQRCPEYFAQALWLIEQVLDGARLRLG